MTGLSRAQLTRLVAQHRGTGHIRDRRGAGPTGRASPISATAVRLFGALSLYG